MKSRFMKSRLQSLVARGAIACAAALVTTGGPAWSQTAAAPAEEPPPKFEPGFLSNVSNVDAGKAVWDGQCRHCHGNSAYPGKAPKLRPGAYTPDFIYDRVTYGFRGMPPWKAVYTLEQRMAVVAYIKSDSFSP
jgi:mono/diheme cytochrome c family protein